MFQIFFLSLFLGRLLTHGRRKVKRAHISEKRDDDLREEEVVFFLCLRNRKGMKNTTGAYVAESACGHHRCSASSVLVGARPGEGVLDLETGKRLFYAADRRKEREERERDGDRETERRRRGGRGDYI